MQKITDENFESEVLNQKGVVLLEFYSDSCIPCKRMSPVLSGIEETFGEVKLGKYNVNIDSKIAGEYNVMSSPTLVFFKDGAEVERRNGIVKKEELEEIIQTVLS